MHCGPIFVKKQASPFIYIKKEFKKTHKNINGLVGLQVVLIFLNSYFLFI